MKPILIFFFLVSSYFVCMGQYIKPNKVPIHIKLVYDSIYPDSPYPAWKISQEIDIITNYQATFSYKNVRTWISIDSLTGRIIETEHIIDKDSIPVKAKEYIKNKHKYWEIGETRRIEIIGKKKTLYFVTFKNNYRLFLFDVEGTLVRKKSLRSFDFLSMAGIMFGAYVGFHPYIYQPPAISK